MASMELLSFLFLGGGGGGGEATEYPFWSGTSV